MSDTKPEMPVAASRSSSGGGDVVGPTQKPPAAALAAADAGGVSASTWISGKTVNSLWSINENRNVFMGVAGVGWVKFANNSDSAIVAFTMLAADAKITQGQISYRKEADGMAHEIYVW